MDFGICFFSFLATKTRNDRLRVKSIETIVQTISIFFCEIPFNQIKWCVIFFLFRKHSTSSYFELGFPPLLWMKGRFATATISSHLTLNPWSLSRSHMRSTLSWRPVIFPLAERLFKNRYRIASWQLRPTDATTRGITCINQASSCFCPLLRGYP